MPNVENQKESQNISPVGIATSVGLDPDTELTEEQLRAIDFSNKPTNIRRLDKIAAEATAEWEKLAKDPFGDLYILTYKSNGPITFTLFRSRKPSPQITRDCQVWCQAHGYRYLSFARALTNLEAKDSINIQQTGDVTSLVTVQSAFFNEQAAKSQDAISRGPVRD